MRNVYLSFLGLGNTNAEQGPMGYRPAQYELNDRISSQTEFVQVAEMELLGGASFDKVFIVTTNASKEAHFDQVRDQMRGFGAHPDALILEEDFSSEGQWRWFETILGVIEPGDNLTVDLTHGYRAVPIIFSAALNFLQKARDIAVVAVYYGVFDKNKKRSPIVNMKDFYVINEWADGVSRLVEDADARKLARVAEQTADFQAGELNDKQVVAALETLTNTVRNVDIQNVSSAANDAVRLVVKKKEGASITGRILLDLVFDKFASLVTGVAASGKYDRAYFSLQIEIIRLLLEHKLFMQAYTVMREFIASIGLIEVPKANVKNNEGRKRRKRFGEPFVNMLQNDEVKWNVGSAAAALENREIRKLDEDWDAMLPFYRKLERTGIVDSLRSFVKALVDYRNGFDHAWTGKDKARDDIDAQGSVFLKQLIDVVSLLEKEHVL